MNLLSGIFGKFLYIIGRILEILLNILIDIMEAIMKVLNLIKDLAIGIFSGPILAILLIMVLILGPFIFLILGPLLFSSNIFRWVIVFVIFRVLFKYGIDLFKLLRFSLVEYLYGKSDYLIDGTEPRHRDFMAYVDEYLDKKRQEKYKKFNEEFFDFKTYRTNFDWKEEDFNSGQFYGNRTGFGGASYGFKEEYEKACDTLGLDYGAGEEEVKKNYRLLAKKYHPDLNKEPGAKERFQEINEANEFLSRENIELYRSMK